MARRLCAVFIPSFDNNNPLLGIYIREVHAIKLFGEWFFNCNNWQTWNVEIIIRFDGSFQRKSLCADQYPDKWNEINFYGSLCPIRVTLVVSVTPFTWIDFFFSFKLLRLFAIKMKKKTKTTFFLYRIVHTIPNIFMHKI